MYGDVQENGSCRIRINKVIQYILQGAYIITFIKLLTLRYSGHTERRNNERTQNKKGHC
jgi:hypothetical protein